MKNDLISIWNNGYRCCGKMYQCIKDLVDDFNLSNDGLIPTNTSRCNGKGSDVLFKSSDDDDDDEATTQGTKLIEPNTNTRKCSSKRKIE